MDGLSVAASIAGVVALADTIFTRTYRYIKTAKHAAKEINELATAARNLSSLLLRLQILLETFEEDTQGSNSPKLSDFRLHYINSCTTTLTNIQRKLDKHSVQSGDGRSAKNVLKILKWPFSAAETKDLLTQIEKHMTGLEIAISGDTLIAVLQVLSRQDELQADLNDLKKEQKLRWAAEDRIRLDEKRQVILDFFGKVDPTLNHRMSLELRHPLTGLWLTNGLPFRTWLLTQNSKLWLSGIAGAGKSVLAASVIEEALKQSSPDRAVAYFYCDYKNKDKQNPVSILGSLATQLARQSEKAFLKLQTLYDVCHPEGKSKIDADTGAIINTIQDISTGFDEVSIIVDGLEECGEHTDKVVDSLAKLANDKGSNTRTLFLSRDEEDIRQILQPDYERLEIAAQSEDLRVYVAAEIEERQHKVGREKLKIKNAALKEHIMKELVERADGMFRWVACQLDYLCSLSTDAEKRKALLSLPPGLNSTYERILQRVDDSSESVRMMVQRALQWIVNGVEPLSIDALCHAISINEGDTCIDEDGLVDEEDLLLHCSSLIRRSASGKHLETAHFSVEEYLSLLSDREDSPYSRYSQMKSHVYPKLAVICLTYNNFDCFNKLLDGDDIEGQMLRETRFPLRKHAITFWNRYTEDYWQDNRIIDLVKSLFHPSISPAFRSLSFETIRANRRYGALISSHNVHNLAKNLTPLHMAALLRLPNICDWLVALGCDINCRSQAGTPLHCALLGMHNLLYAYGNYPHMIYHLWFPDHATSSDQLRMIGTLEILLANGADANEGFEDSFSSRYSCISLALKYKFGISVEAPSRHPLIQLIVAGARLDEHSLKLLLLSFDSPDNPEFDDNFRAELSKKLQESTQDLAIRLKITNHLLIGDQTDVSSSGFRGTTTMSLGKLIDLFRFAIESDSVQMMESLIEDQRLDLSYRSHQTGASYLHYAAGHGSLDAARLLLSLDIERNSADFHGETPLHYGIQNWQDDKKGQQITMLLLDNHADPSDSDDEMWTCWHVAANLSSHESAAAMKCLLVNCATDAQAYDAADINGWVPLYIAAQRGNIETCKLLFSHNANIPHKSPEGLGLVHYAIKMGSVSLLKMLLEKGYNIAEKTADGRAGLHFISENVTTEVVHFLLKAGVDTASPACDGTTPLHIFESLWPPVEIESFGLLLDLIATGQTINKPDASGRTPLYYALNISSYWQEPKSRLPRTHSLNRSRSKFRSTNTNLLSHSSVHASRISMSDCDIDEYMTAYRKRAEDLILRGADVQAKLPDGQFPLSSMISTFARLASNEGLSVRYLFSQCAAIEYLCTLIVGSASFNQMEMLEGLVLEDYSKGHKIRLLNWFIASESEAAIDICLQNGIDVDLCDEGNNDVQDSWSAVHYACYYGCSTDLFGRILRASKDPLRFDSKGRSPLHLVHEIGNNADVMIIRELCASGMDPNIFNDQDGSTPLMLAARNRNLEKFQALLDRGADPFVKDWTGAQAAHYAAQEGNVPILESLISMDIDWNECLDGDGYNILHRAIDSGKAHVADVILKNHLIDDIDAFNDFKQTALHMAVNNGNMDHTQLLLRAGADMNIEGERGIRPIHLAARSGNLKIIGILLRYGCDLSPDDTGMTPYLEALMGEHTQACNVFEFERRSGTIKQPLSAVTKSKMLECLKIAIAQSNYSRYASLVAAGTDIQGSFRCGCTPLLYALFYRDERTIRDMIEQDASSEGRLCSICSSGSQTAIHLACDLDQDSRDNILKAILSHNHKITGLAFRSPISPLHTAVANRNLEAIRLLLQYWQIGPLNIPNNSNIDFSSENWDICHEYKPKIHSSVILNAQLKKRVLQKPWYISTARRITTNDFKSGTPLHLAASIGYLEGAELLLRYGAYVDSTDDDDNTPLMIACFKGNVPVVRLLLEKGANVSKRDRFGTTPAMSAAANGCNLESFKLVLDPTIDLTLTYGGGGTVLHYASAKSPQIFSYLLSRGCDQFSEDYFDETPLSLAMYKGPYLSSFRSLLFNLDLDYSRLEGLLSGLEIPWAADHTKTVQFFIKRVPQDVVQFELGATTFTTGTILGDASRNGAFDVVKILLQAGASIDLDQGQHGTALMIACEFGRLDVVKLLVRAGAKISSTKAGKPCSAIDAAKPFPEITHWLLVGRHTEQPRLAISSNVEGQGQIYAWSGVRRGRVEIIGLYTPTAYRSSFEHACDLAELRRELLGEVVDVMHILDT